MRRKKKTKRRLLKLGVSTKKKKRRADGYRPSLLGVLTVLVGICIFAGIGVGLFLLNRYVNKTGSISGKRGVLELVKPPAWLNEELKEKIYAAATAHGEDLRLDEDAARSVQQNIEELVGWLDEVEVQTTGETIRIRARWRKPIALVKRGLVKFYVDGQMVVLDFVPIENLPIVKVRGLSAIMKLPAVGEVWQRQDLAAAVLVF